MSDVSAVVHLLPTANEGFITTLGNTISSGAVTVPLTSLTGLVDGTTFVGILEPGTDKQQVFTGVVDTGGSQITGVVYTRGSNTSHTAGVTVVDYVTGTAINMITRWAAVEHNDDGTHGDMTAGTIDASGLIRASGGLTVPPGQVATVPAGSFTDVQYFEPSGVNKVAYSTSSWTTFTSQAYTPALTGTLVIDWRATFGFHTVASTGGFRIVINDGTTDFVISVAAPEDVFADTAAFTPVSVLGHKATVTGGHAYTIKLQTKGNTDIYSNSYYIFTQQLLCNVTM